MRRLREKAGIRELVNETRLSAKDLILPLFIIEGNRDPQPVESMPGVFRIGIEDLLRECERAALSGIKAVVLFPCLDSTFKDPTGREALNPETLVLRAVRAIKERFPELIIFTDIALDPYTSHGHDGIVSECGRFIANDETVEILRQMAGLHAAAGVDMVAPSDMMDGRVGAIREYLDQIGETQTGILAYSAKFASAFYGPFRDAVGSASAAGTMLLDKSGYQLNPANPRESIEDALLDEKEGADILMVKPAGPYLDILKELRGQTRLPLAAYQVSGEYAQLHAAAEKGWLDLDRCAMESLLAIKRAGADMILTYFAQSIAPKLKG